MKIRRLQISGLRGAPVQLDVDLGNKSCAVLGENGSGKSSISDAAAFWSDGDLEGYHRENCDLAAAIHLDANEASVTVEIDGFPPLRRTLGKSGAASDIEPDAPLAVERVPAPIPYLRHSTMASFMQCTAGEKRKELLKILGLDELNTFRDVLVTARNNAKAEADEAEAMAAREVESLEDVAGGDPVEAAEKYRRQAGLDTPISSLDDLRNLKMGVTSSRQLPNPLGRVDELVRTIAAAPAAPGGWNDVLSDRAAVEADALGTLLRAGERALGVWSREECPLCLSPKDPAQLAGELQQRAAEYAAAQRRMVAGRTALREHEQAMVAIAREIARVEEVAPEGGWPRADALRRQREELELYAEAAARARERTEMSPPAPELHISTIVDELRAAAAADAGSDATRAAWSLGSLCRQAQRVEAAAQRADAERKMAAAVQRLKEIAESEAQRAIEGALTELGGLAADYYSRLTCQPHYSDILLRYRPARGGQVEFHLVFDGRFEVTPPQRIMSESQLNALGLALFLARVKLQEAEWRTLVLDDVVNSFDAAHRQGLARLLADEFHDWQIIVLTHDIAFFDLLQTSVGRGWIWREIVAWTPVGGPEFAEGDAVRQLRDRLSAGRQASELGGLARRALEESLSRPLEKLRYPIRHDPHGRYSAQELLIALRRGLSESKSPLATLPVLQRMAGDAYISNFGVHYRPSAPALTTGDVQRLADDLDELRSGFVCPACEQPVWAAERPNGRHQCRCAQLAA